MQNFTPLERNYEYSEVYHKPESPPDKIGNGCFIYTKFLSEQGSESNVMTNY